MRICTFLDPRQKERCTECGITIDLCQCRDVNQSAYERTQTPEGEFLRAIEAETVHFERTTHRFESLVKLVGELGVKLVSNADTGSPAPSDIYQTLAKIGAVTVKLGSGGTDEYPYIPE